jgi:hypothetical protein
MRVSARSSLSIEGGMAAEGHVSTLLLHDNM